jgi:hypothetical protein
MRVDPPPLHVDVAIVDEQGEAGFDYEDDRRCKLVAERDDDAHHHKRERDVDSEVLRLAQNLLGFRQRAGVGTTPTAATLSVG